MTGSGDSNMIVDVPLVNCENLSVCRLNGVLKATTGIEPVEEAPRGREAGNG